MFKGIVFGLLSCAAVFATPLGAFSQFSPAPVSASTIPSDHLMQATDLVRVLHSGKAQPLILQVGSRLFFNEAHIKGSQYAGAGSQPAGLQALQSMVAKQPKNRFIVLYCGCCPWNHCPNVGPAFQRLHDLGFSHVSVLFLPNNFGDDWAAKGYPTDRNQ
jgi:thiosulfate/3-mercaptopyruvate sulfurtransferase